LTVVVALVVAVVVVIIAVAVMISSPWFPGDGETILSLSFSLSLVISVGSLVASSKEKGSAISVVLRSIYSITHPPHTLHHPQRSRRGEEMREEKRGDEWKTERMKEMNGRLKE
jgi:hypothetical protein